MFFFAFFLILNFFNAPQKEAFTTNKAFWNCFALAQLYVIQTHIFLTKNMAQNAVLLWNNILSVHSCMCIECMLSHWLSKIFIPTFVYHHFWPKCFVEPYVLIMIHDN
jgi:hypothetical protein